MEGLLDPVDEFRATFPARAADVRADLEDLTKWASRLSREGIVQLTYGVGPGGRDRYLELAPPGRPTLLHVVNSSKASIYSYAYARLGQDRFLTDRLGGSRVADDALRDVELLAQGKALWITEFSTAVFVGLEQLLRLAASVTPKPSDYRGRCASQAPTRGHLVVTEIDDLIPLGPPFT